MKTVLTQLLMAVLLLGAGGLAGAISGISYQTARHAEADHAELQRLQRAADGEAERLRNARRASEARLQQRITTLQDELRRSQGQADETHHTFTAGVRSGTIGVRVPIVPTSCPGHGLRAPADPAAAAAPAHAQLEPAAAANLAAIPHDGDAAIRELNYCIERYNAMKKEVDDWRNALSPTEPRHAQTR